MMDDKTGMEVEGMYRGALQGGKANGQGEVMWKVKATGKEVGMYKGGFQDGKMHGKGVFIWSTGEMYDGDWQNNDQQGTGVMKQKDGSVLHSGSWAYGKVVVMINAPFSMPLRYIYS